MAEQPIDLGAKDAPLRALVNSFGFGGTNSCALLSSADSSGSLPNAKLPAESRTDPGRAPAPCAIPLSAPTQQHLQQFAATLARAIDDGPLSGKSVSEIAGAMIAQRDHAGHRAVIIAATPDELCERLTCLSEGCDWPAVDRHAPPEIITGKAESSRTIAFTMTGQGGQWWSMGRELIAQDDVFRGSIEAFDSVFKEIGGWSVIDVLMADEETSNIHDAAITPAVMFAFPVRSCGGLACARRASRYRSGAQLRRSDSSLSRGWHRSGDRRRTGDAPRAHPKPCRPGRDHGGYRTWR